MDATQVPEGLHTYALDDDFYDEAFEAGGAARAHYETVLAELEHVDLHELQLTVAADLVSRGVAFQGAGGRQRFRVDPVPRVMAADEWDRLEAGLCQRVRALNAFLADAYGGRRIVEAGVMPERVINGAEGLEPLMQGVHVPHHAYAGMAGLDIVRGPDGRLMVLEDNLRTPSGLAYAEAARDVLEERLPESAHEPKRSLQDMYDTLGTALRAAAPEGVDEPSVVLLSDGPANSAWFEHQTIARRLAVPLVALGDLEPRHGRLYARVDNVLRPVDVVYRRTDGDRLTDADGHPTAVAQALLGPLQAGTLACFNAFGAGLADDKLVHAYVEDMVRFYLGQEPLIDSVPTYDLGDPAVRPQALARLDEMVVKPRTGYGGHGVVIVRHVSNDERERVARAVRFAPNQFIAQETIGLSRHPTICDGRLAPRHVDLRPFVLTAGEDVAVIPGGLTRVAFDAGVLVVNSSQNGGGKDTWVLERGH
jgi:uncharacterized circularly permuted ATP-grasp superfamily protein